jgi:hypothetical protein
MSALEKFLLGSNMANDRGVNYFSVVYTGHLFIYYYLFALFFA